MLSKTKVLRTFRSSVENVCCYNSYYKFNKMRKGRNDKYVNSAVNLLSENECSPLNLIRTSLEFRIMRSVRIYQTTRFKTLPELTLSQTTIFRLIQTGRVCRWQFQIWWKWQKAFQTNWKLREKEKLLGTSNFSFSPQCFQKTCTADTWKQGLKVPIAANWKGFCLQNTRKPHSYQLKIWWLLWFYG